MSDLNIDIATLRLIARRDRYDKFAKMIPDGTVNDTTRTLIKRMGEFFAANDAEIITHEIFWPYMRTRYPKWTEKDAAFWQKAIAPIDTPNPPGTEEQIIANLLATKLGNVSLELIEKWNNGADVDLATALRGALDEFDTLVTRRVRTADVDLDWGTMIEQAAHPTGLEWPEGCLREYARPLSGGDFGILAMRPDRGKTSLGAFIAAHMAPQVHTHWPDRKRPVVWLNNEGPGHRILGRIRQSVLGLSLSEIAEVGADAARARYNQLMRGDADLIVVKDIHGFSSWDVETLLQRLDPGLVIWDMIDNVKFAGGLSNNGERNDQVLEAMYAWARSLAVKYDHAGIAMSQLSADAEGVRYPAQSMLKDSKTGKQGACDFIIAGGYDPQMPNTRFISMPKNKLKMEGKAGSPRCPLFFDMDRAQFYQPEGEE